MRCGGNMGDAKLHRAARTCKPNSRPNLIHDIWPPAALFRALVVIQKPLRGLIAARQRHPALFQAQISFARVGGGRVGPTSAGGGVIEAPADFLVAFEHRLTSATPTTLVNAGCCARFPPYPG